MSPERSDLVLSTDVPNIELCVLVRDRFDVEANCRYCCDVRVELELVEYCYVYQLECTSKVKLIQCILLVLPAASSPSISSRISFDPKILFIIFEMDPPIALQSTVRPQQ